MSTEITEPIPFTLRQALRELRGTLREETGKMGREQARVLVDSYYQLQEQRKRGANQIRALAETEEPTLVLEWLFGEFEWLEGELRRTLKDFADNEPSGMGVWSQGIVGIGPVLSAGLLAHIDITKAPTAGAIWRYAGLDPSSTWNKGEKRPWNAALKVLCWKIGDSFVKTSGHPDGYYGHLYRMRKEQEVQYNEEGKFAKIAADTLASKNFKRDTDTLKAYQEGKLPAGRLDLRARRWAVKIFLSHYFAESYRRHYHTEPSLPYAISILGHTHILTPPV